MRLPCGFHARPEPQDRETSALFARCVLLRTLDSAGPGTTRHSDEPDGAERLRPCTEVATTAQGRRTVTTPMDRVNGLIGPSSSDSGPAISHRSHRACWLIARPQPEELEPEDFIKAPEGRT